MCGTSKTCFETCYEKYLKSIGVVNSEIKELGYKNLSLIAYKGYPEDSIDQQYQAEDEKTITYENASFGVQNQTTT
jgi:hypothetical protein